MDPYDYDDSVRREGFTIMAGVDEAGRGPLAGPVVAAAVILPEGVRIEGVRDSKKIPEGERERLFQEIVRSALSIGIAHMSASEIDRLNVLRATREAMRCAVKRLRFSPAIVLVDAVHIPGITVRQMPIIKGDSKSASIAAASIIAKVVRDRMMRRYHVLYPQYGFDRHKGYGTREHLESIHQHGPTPIHRMTFEGVRSLSLPFGNGEEL